VPQLTSDVESRPGQETGPRERTSAEVMILFDQVTTVLMATHDREMPYRLDFG
jgi:hypothetical protein